MTPQPTTTPPQPLTPVQRAVIEAQADKVLQKARATIILDHPFFASPMLKKKMAPNWSVPTARVNARGYVEYNPAFIAPLSNAHAAFVICHELLHYLSGHALRIGTRDHKKWNIAGDYWINETISVSCFDVLPGALRQQGAELKTVEQIYDELPDEDESTTGQSPSGSGDEPSPAAPLSDDIDPTAGGEDGEGGGPLSQAEIAELDAERKLDVAEAAAVAKMKGKLPGALQQFAADTIESRVPWHDVLERYMTAKTKNDSSWARPNRRYAPEFYLPTIDSIGRMGEVVVQVDISGSVSPREIEHYNGHIKAILEQCHPERVHVIYTDTQVQHHDTFDNPDDVAITYRTGGGTDMRAGFNHVEAQGIEPECVITLTDGYTPFPSYTSVPSVWCISTKGITSPVGESIHFEVR